MKIVYHKFWQREIIFKKSYKKYKILISVILAVANLLGICAVSQAKEFGDVADITG